MLVPDRDGDIVTAIRQFGCQFQALRQSEKDKPGCTTVDVRPRQVIQSWHVAHG